jgi:hypothetical protein
MDQRHTLFQLVRLPSSATVGEVAKAHCIKVETLWMLNSGFDPTCQLPPGADRQTLFFKTLLLK